METPYQIITRLGLANDYDARVIHFALIDAGYPSGVGTLNAIAVECERRSRAWFPGIYDAQSDVPLPAYFAIAMMGEAGETCNLIKKKIRDGAGLPDYLLAFEIVDTLIYVLLLARSLGIDLEDAYALKVEVLKERWGDV